MGETINEELDAIHSAEHTLANHIRTTIIADIDIGKFNIYELSGRLGCSRVGVEALKTRKTWTLRYAITIARKLGYSLGNLQVIPIE